jgi:protein TonB
MTGKEILMSDALDILFDNRNKSYGAYLLRKNYNQRLTLALGLALSTPFLLFLFAGTDKNQHTMHHAPSVVVVRDVVLPKDPVLPKKPALPQPAIAKPAMATRAFVDRIKFVPDDRKLTQTIPLQSAMNDAIPATVTAPGTLPGTGIYTPSAQGPTISKPEPPAAAPLQRDPEFPGGRDAWTRFLKDNLRSPGILMEGEKVTVLIKFQVATDGAVTGFEVLQSGGREFDREVIRVLKRMPKWKPAIRNDQPVAWFYTQPVTFMALAE